jgi:hypothetical protein
VRGSRLRAAVRLVSREERGAELCSSCGTCYCVPNFRQVGGLLAFEDAIDIAGGAAVLVDEIRPVGDQAAGGDVAAAGIDCGQPVAGRDCDDRIALKQPITAKSRSFGG